MKNNNKNINLSVNVAAYITEEIVSQAERVISDKKIKKIFPKSIMKSFRGVLGEISKQELETKTQARKSLLKQLPEQQSIKADNLSVGDCKIQFSGQSKCTQFPVKKSRYSLKTAISQNKIQRKIESSLIKDKKSSAKDRQTKTKSLPQLDADTEEYKKKKNKNLAESKLRSRLISLLAPRSTQETEQMLNQQKMRNDLLAKKEKQTLQSQSEFALRKMKKKKQQRMKEQSAKIKEVKSFSFGYDSSILSAKNFVPQDDVSESVVRVRLKVSEKVVKTSRVKPQRSIDSREADVQIIDQQFKPAKPQKQRGHALKAFKTEISFNKRPQKSLIQGFNSKDDLKEGISVKEKVDGKTLTLKRSVKIKLFERQMSQNEFKTTFGEKKFVSPILTGRYQTLLSQRSRRVRTEKGFQ